MGTRIHRSAVGFEHVITQRFPQALGCQLVGIQLACTWVGRDFLVHQRLGQRGSVLLVVAQFAEASDVNHHILAELHAELQGQLGCQHNGFRIVAIDVQHGCVHHLDDVGAICGGTHIAGVGSGETDLVVDDQVNRTASGVATGLGQRQCFLVDTLTTESGVAMYQHRQHLVATWIATAIHAGTHRTFNHRVDDFQVGWVEGQRQMHRAAGRGQVRAETLVVLHVTSG